MHGSLSLVVALDFDTRVDFKFLYVQTSPVVRSHIRRLRIEVRRLGASVGSAYFGACRFPTRRCVRLPHFVKRNVLVARRQRFSVRVRPTVHILLPCAVTGPQVLRYEILRIRLGLFACGSLIDILGASLYIIDCTSSRLRLGPNGFGQFVSIEICLVLH